MEEGAKLPSFLPGWLHPLSRTGTPRSYLSALSPFSQLPVFPL